MTVTHHVTIPIYDKTLDKLELQDYLTPILALCRIHNFTEAQYLALVLALAPKAGLTTERLNK